MIDTKEQASRHLSAIVGLELTSVSHTADVFALQFGALRVVTPHQGTIRRLGTWSLHIRCNWRIEQGNVLLASHSHCAPSEDNPGTTAQRMRDRLVAHGPTVVKTVTAGENGDACLFLTRGIHLLILPDAIPGNEDWRMFPSSNPAAHFVIEGGRVASGVPS